MSSLAGVDLNLAVALRALLAERNVTRAARRIGLSQPAMSHALARLREHFDDPLLVRSGKVMVPTTFALALLPGLDRASAELEQIFFGARLDPSTLQANFRLIADDWMGVVVLPRVLAAIASQAGGVAVDVLARGAPGRKALLRQGEADLAVGYFSGAGTDLHRRSLFDDRWTVVLRRGHPALGEPLTLDRWAELTHIVVSPTGGRRGSLDARFEALGRTRRVAVAVPHFLSALALASASDHALAVPHSLATERAEAFGLVALEPPIPLEPFSVVLCWHPRADSDPAQIWLRELFLSTARPASA